jgi:hypothetical protein
VTYPRSLWLRPFHCGGWRGRSLRAGTPCLRESGARAARRHHRDRRLTLMPLRCLEQAGYADLSLPMPKDGSDRTNANFHEAALHGSSHYDLPNVLRWFTANIGVHHVHHLCSRIPYYRLPRVLRDHPELAAVGRLTLLESLRCVRMVLWDEKERRLISFREVHILGSLMNRTPAAVASQG